MCIRDSPGVLALLYTVLFCVGLYPVTSLYKKPYWPGPWEPASVIVPYFQTYGARVLFCLVLQFGAMICLGIFVADVYKRQPFVPVSNAEGLHRGLPKSKLDVIDCGHFVWEEAPEVYGALACDFIQGGYARL